jgi:para-nitrobenzyl esterase
MRTTRRDLIAGTTAFTAAFSIAPCFAAGRSEELIVATAQGKLRGSRTAGVSSFLGIPYGKAGRFMAPAAADPWTGTRDALKFGTRAPQTLIPPRLLPPVIQGFARFSEDPVGEDCLVLNVWTPAADHRKRPVMVWLHGGGWSTGSGQEPDYKGANLARNNDAVVVTINHRLNAFGYCYVGHLGDERFATSGNAGALDMVQALKWVRENIARFGGDAGNVTVFGQSGGGAKVSVVLAMPAAKGLFHKAIIMSGPGVRMTERSEAEEMTDTMMRRMGLGRGDLEKLRAAPMADVFKAVGTPLAGPGAGIDFKPVVDGKALPAHPFDPAAPAISAQIPLIVGATRDEMTTLQAMDVAANKLTEDALIKRVEGVAPGRGRQIVDGYKALRPGATPAFLWADIATDRWTLAGNDTLCDRKVAQGQAPLYRYLVTWPMPYMNGMFGAAHGEDMALVFDNVEVARSNLGQGPEAQQMADAMSRAFVAFARTGRPDHAGIPKWLPYGTARRETLVFDVPSRMADDPQASERALWRTT